MVTAETARVATAAESWSQPEWESSSSMQRTRIADAPPPLAVGGGGPLNEHAFRTVPPVICIEESQS